MNVEITVLIPAYNAAKTIARAINSIKNQTYDQKKIKIIVVNDGSKDSTLNILNEFQKELGENKMKIISRENKGLSATRNELISNVTTPWYIFLDADDYYTPKAFEQITNVIKPNTDIVCSKVIWWKLNTFKRSCLVNFFNKNTSYSKYITHADFGYLWNKLYRTDFARKISLDTLEKLTMFENLYSERLTMFEDLYLNSLLFDKKPNIALCTKHTYAYIKQKKNMNISAKRTNAQFSMFSEMLKNMVKICNNSFFITNFYYFTIAFIASFYGKEKSMRTIYRKKIEEFRAIVPESKKHYKIKICLWRKIYYRSVRRMLSHF